MNHHDNIDQEKVDYQNEVAIIGMAGRFPGAKHIHEFWKNLVDGVDCITFYSDEDLLEAGVEPEVLKNPDYVKAKGELEGTDLFDAAFFGINPREAELTDPQHRLLLECAWEAMEDAGYDSSKYDGLIGVYAGKSMDFYLMLNLLPNVQKKISAGYLHAAIGNDKDSLTTTISYRLNLTGPAVTVQTSSSTSLVAVCEACQSLLAYQCDMALAGGITAGPPIKSGYFYENEGIWSPDGHTRAFDAKARGFVHASGMGVVVLKRLEDARADGDHIWAVIKGAAINNDGSRKVSYTSPSVEGQENVILQAMAAADVHPETIQFVETHGTATRLGDPIEMTALIRAFRSYTDKKQFCAIGSAKTNIGHLDIAAGVASLIKTALALKYKMIPASLYFEEPNPRIDFENSPFYVNTKLNRWEADGRGTPRRAGVTSIGMGGTNAHVILEEACSCEPTGPSRPRQLLLFSAQTETALEVITGNLLEFLRKQNNHNDHEDYAKDLNFADAAYTLKSGRRDFNHRRMVLGRGLKDAITHMEERTSGCVIDSRCGTFSTSVAFMFSGAGSQYVNMGKELYQNEPVFKRNMDKCAGFLAPLLGIDLREVVYPKDEKDVKECERKLNQTWITHPVLFMFEYALAQLWMDWGVEPAGMIGHSIGELVASCISGCFSLEDALGLTAARSRLMQSQEEGIMLAVHVNEARLMEILPEHDDISLAAVNSPDLCVISGPLAAVESFKPVLVKKKWVYRPLATSHAFHSKMMEPVKAALAKVLGGINLNPPQIPFISGVTGTWITGAETLDPQYWLEQLRQPVRFSDGILEILENPSRVLLEIGPGNSLCALAQQHKQDETRKTMFASTRYVDQKESDSAFLLKTLGKLWLSGVPINWKNFYRGEKRRRIPLPTYPFERKRYWVEEDKEILPETRFKAKKDKKKKIKIEPEAPPAIEPAAGEVQGGVKEAARKRPQLKTRYIPPANDLDQEIVKIWEELLGIKSIGIEDNFFELGGHSLLATIFLSQLQEKFQTRLGLNTIFENPTVSGITALIKSEASGLNEISMQIPGKDGKVNIQGTIPPAKPSEFYQLSPTQKRQFILNQLDGNTTNYTITRTYLVEGLLDREKVEKTIYQVIARQESLRTSFHIFQNQPLQKIENTVDFSVEYFEEENGNAKAVIIQMVRPYDLSHPPLFRVGVVKIGKEKYILLVDMHHIISDGTSFNIFIREMVDIYGEKKPESLKINYKDFAEWQYGFQETGVYREQEKFWLKKFENKITKLNLPTDYSRPAIQSFEGETVDFELDSQLTRELKDLMAKTNTTLYMVLLAIFSLFLGKLTGQQEINIGTAVAGRDYHAELQKVIGMFLNSLVLISTFNDHMTFTQLLSEVKREALTVFENQNYPFENLVNKIGVERDTSHNPIFDVMYILQNFKTYEVSLPDLTIKHTSGIYEDNTSKVDLLLNSIEHQGKIFLLFEYCTKLFKKSTIERFVTYFKELTFSISKDPDKKIADFDMIPRQEKEQVLYGFNQTGPRYPENITVQELFENQVERMPEKAAVVDKERKITYRELNENSNRLAHYLRDRYHVESNDVVGISVERSIEMITAILGIVKSGAGYVAIDPGYPKERTSYILKDSSTDLVIVDKVSQQLLGAFTGEIIDILGDRDTIKLRPRENPGIINKPDDLLYVIYTSGTTGTPNGARLSHDLLVNLVQWQQNETAIDSTLRCLQFTSINFCVSFQEIMCTLTAGGELYLIGDIERQDIDYLMKFLARFRIEILYLPFSYLNFLFNESGKWAEAFDHNLKHIITAGEQLKISRAMQRFQDDNPGVLLHNHYGSSEMHVVTSYSLDRSLAAAYPIPPAGKPIANTKIYILDDRLKPVPIGVWGEIFVESRRELLGYINNDALTDKKMIHVAELSEKRLYRSGDIGRWLEDGNIELGGRKDFQVKIRGFRVEPGEIESKLLALEGVKDCVAVVREDGNQQKNMYAYIVPDNTDLSSIRIALGSFLPQPMMPRLVELESLPLMPNGKVDRENLPEPKVVDMDREFAPPTTRIEIAIAEIWKEVLQLEAIGIYHNFFDIGGNSLSIIKVNDRLKELFKRDIPLVKMFEYATISELEEYLADNKEDMSGREALMNEMVSKAKTRIKRISKHQ